MKRIPTLFQRDPSTGLCIPEVSADCEWVLQGEGIATRQYDGICMFLDKFGLWWVRRKIPFGTAPPGQRNFRVIERRDDEQVVVGWERGETSPIRAHLNDALHFGYGRGGVGTYELCGPKVHGNPENFRHHVLIEHVCHCNHGCAQHATDIGRWLPDRSYEGLRRELEPGHFTFHGVVWHHADGRMAKLKPSDLF